MRKVFMQKLGDRLLALDKVWIDEQRVREAIKESTCMADKKGEYILKSEFMAQLGLDKE